MWCDWRASKARVGVSGFIGRLSLDRLRAYLVGLFFGSFGRALPNAFAERVIWSCFLVKKRSHAKHPLNSPCKETSESWSPPILYDKYKPCTLLPCIITFEPGSNNKASQVRSNIFADSVSSNSYIHIRLYNINTTAAPPWYTAAKPCSTQQARQIAYILLQGIGPGACDQTGTSTNPNHFYKT